MTVDAILLAGGQGTRLRSAVADLPKALAPVGGRPFIEWLLFQLRAQGIRHIVVSTGHLAEAIEERLGNGARFDVTLTYARETQPLGTAGAVKYAAAHTSGDPVLVLNADSYCNFDAAALLADYAAHAPRATLWVAHVDDSSRYGTLRTDAQGGIQSFVEKSAEPVPGDINAGVYALSRALIDAIPAGAKVSLEHDVFARLAGHGLRAVPGRGAFLDIGTPEAYASAAATLEHEFAAIMRAWQTRRVRDHMAATALVFARAAEDCTPALLDATGMLAASFRAGGKVLICGNGGSAADAQHLAAEFVSRLTKEFPRPALPAIALTTDSSFITAYANDIAFEGIFARQVEALGKRGDVLIGFSTSGASRNVMLALQAARERGMGTIAVTGAGGPLHTVADVAIAVPSTQTQPIQECTVAIYHLLCDLTERALFG